MYKTALALLIAFAVTPALAQRKDCNELKSEIDAKITKNGVQVFNTTIVDKDAAEDGKVVGTCDGGTRKIVYKRGEMASGEGMAKPAGDMAKPTSKQ
ncbi:MAG: DUF1161 domain-containing protein [Burkholderiales bacterium]